MNNNTVEINGKIMTVAEFEVEDNLTVYSYLNLKGLPVTTLPDGLTVAGYLDIEGTLISTLPDNLTVYGAIYIDNYSVYFFSPSEMKIGRERHALDKWEQFTNRDILAMGGKTALTPWKKWKTPLIKHGRAIPKAEGK